MVNFLLGHIARVILDKLDKLKERKKISQIWRCFSKSFSRRQQILGSFDHFLSYSFCDGDMITLRDLVQMLKWILRDAPTHLSFPGSRPTHSATFWMAPTCTASTMNSAGTGLNIPVSYQRKSCFDTINLSVIQTQNQEVALEISISFTPWTE